jgi:hypothetical protein
MSRIEAARRRSTTLKKTLAGIAAASLVVAGVLARATHPGHAARASRSTQNSSSSGTTSSDTQSSDTQSSGAQSSGDFSISPSLSQPKVETSVS